MKKPIIFFVASVLLCAQVSVRAEEAAVDALAPGTEVMQPAAPLPADRGQRLDSLQKNGRPHFALILAGGGARGAAHIGVFKVLESEGIKADLVCGNSIGSILGALYCAGVPAATMEKWMLDGTITKALFPRPIQWQTALYAAKFSLMRLLRLKQDIGMYSGKKIAKFINSKMPPGVARMEDLPVPLAVIATNMLDTRPVWITSGNIGEAVRASSSVPLIYKPTKMDGRLLVDGGIRSNLPLDTARATGADVVVAVKLHSTLDAKKASEFRTMKSFADRIMSILIAEIEAKNVGQADILIEPEIVDDSLYSFKRESMVNAMAAGEKAARDALPQIRAALAKSGTTATSKQAPAI